MSDESLQRFCSAVIDYLRNPWIRWSGILLAVALAAVSVSYTLTHLKIDTDRKNLISAKKDLIHLTDRIDRAFGGRDGMIVVVQNAERRLLKPSLPSYAVIRINFPTWSVLGPARFTIGICLVLSQLKDDINFE